MDLQNIFELFKSGDLSNIPIPNIDKLYHEYKSTIDTANCSSCVKRRLNRKFRAIIEEELKALDCLENDVGK